ncbi:hypothetical protein ACN26P_003371 [Vibrio cholerae]|nr:hypothetical protein [Vibrio cholerae]
MNKHIYVKTTIGVVCDVSEENAITASLMAQYSNELKKVEHAKNTTDGRVVMRFEVSSSYVFGCSSHNDSSTCHPDKCDCAGRLSMDPDSLDAEQNQMAALLKQGTRKEQAKENCITQWFKKHFCR